MTPEHQVFVSYKRDDEPRVARLVQALEKKGFRVWWDRDLAHDGAWRGRIQQALEASGCVVVVWTEASIEVPPEGSFVVEEAADGKRRGVLVSVRLDRVRAPLGFRESAQPVDLMHWKGRPDDPFFVDLCNAISAKLDGRDAPAPLGHRTRWRRRLAWGAVGGLLASGSMAFSVPLFAPVDAACTFGAFQPELSDICGAFGLGRRPTRAERVAWAAREPGSCESLRQHVQRFPDGHYRSLAADLLTARRVTPVERWSPGSRELPLFVGGDGDGQPTEAAARESAQGRAQRQAERLCRGFAATSHFRPVRAQPEGMEWQCRRDTAGHACQGEGKAVCSLEERQVDETERCGAD